MPAHRPSLSRSIREKTRALTILLIRLKEISQARLLDRHFFPSTVPFNRVEFNSQIQLLPDKFSDLKFLTNERNFLIFNEDSSSLFVKFQLLRN